MADRTWSLDGIDELRRWPAADGERSVRQALWTILLTRPGERVMRPEFGVGLERFVHQPNHAGTRQLIASEVERAVRRFEPRIELDAVEVVPDALRASWVRIAIRYRLRQSGSLAETSLELELAG
ncbi:MAG TPA: GPW/gp25 family protein [Polyangiaceae bacterium]|jgi:phage baseplate assembly protein W|nr:GPW/gp25 family protein [Polyangiaceae bacterium]